MNVTVEEMKQAFDQEITQYDLKAQQGNCGMFATAMKRFLGEGTIWTSYNETMGVDQSAHVVLEWKGYFWDSDGYREKEAGKEVLKDKARDMHYGHDYGDEALHVEKGDEAIALKTTCSIQGWNIEEFYYVFADSLDKVQSLQPLDGEVKVEKFKIEDEGWFYRFEKPNGDEAFVQANSREEAVEKLS